MIFCIYVKNTSYSYLEYRINLFYLLENNDFVFLKTKDKNPSQIFLK